MTQTTHRTTLALLVLLALFTVTACDSGGPKAATTGFEWSEVAPLFIQFVYTGSDNAELYRYNFGDGTGSNRRDTTHEYRDVGFYTVTLVACPPGHDFSSPKCGVFEALVEVVGDTGSASNANAGVSTTIRLVEGTKEFSFFDTLTGPE